MHKTYYELSLTPSEARSHFIDFIFELGYDAIEEREESIIVRSEDDVELLDFALGEFKKRLSETLKREISLKTKIEKKLNRDWISEYKNSVKPIKIGNFFIRPGWIEKKENAIDIRIDPALAFGSGHHETTSGCLEMLQKYVKRGDIFLDVGCGSGILSIAAAKLGAVVDFCDTDELAVESSKENFRLNGVSFRNCWVGSLEKRSEGYDVVAANIVADVLIMLSEDLKRALKRDGIIILSGILDRYIERVEDCFGNFSVLDKHKKNEWYTLVLKR